jgi:hypothetical protein
MQRLAVSPGCHRIGSSPSRFSPLRLLLSAALTVVAGWPALAQVQQEAFSYPVGLDPYGDNFLALRSLPSGTQGVRLARLGPDTLFTELGRQGGWVNIQLPSGQTGWVSARYVGCCRTAASTRSAPSGSASSSCEELWSERNTIFKAAGYCFRTPQAIQAFGNAGCQFDDEADVPLSTRQREQVAQIRATERQLGCLR